MRLPVGLAYGATRGLAPAPAARNLAEGSARWRVWMPLWTTLLSQSNGQDGLSDTMSSHALPGTDEAVLPRVFLDKYGGALHPALEPVPPMDGQRFAPTPQIVTSTEELKRVVAIYQQTAKPKKLPQFDLSHTHTWDEVLEAANRAKAEYEASGKPRTASGILHGAFRSLGNAGPIVNPWLYLLPSGEYTSVVCGSLKLIFDAAARIAEKREQLLLVLDQIPGAITRAEQFRRVYNKDVQLQTHSTNLYLAILHAVGGIIDWLVPDNHTLNRLASFVKGTAADTKLDGCLKHVQDALKELNDWVDILNARTMKQSGIKLDRIEPRVNQAAVNTTLMLPKVESTSINTQSMAIKLDAMEPRMNETHQIAEATYLKTQQLQQGLAAQESLIHIFQDTWRHALCELSVAHI